jgi:hypothetical protein
LLKDATSYKPEIESFRQLCQKVSGYYLIERYPLFIESGLTCEEVKKDLEEAKRLINEIFPEEKLND